MSCRTRHRPRVVRIVVKANPARAGFLLNATLYTLPYRKSIDTDPIDYNHLFPPLSLRAADLHRAPDRRRGAVADRSRSGQCDSSCSHRILRHFAVRRCAGWLRDLNYLFHPFGAGQEYLCGSIGQVNYYPARRTTRGVFAVAHSSIHEGDGMAHSAPSS